MRKLIVGNLLTRITRMERIARIIRGIRRIRLIRVLWTPGILRASLNPSGINSVNYWLLSRLFVGVCAICVYLCLSVVPTIYAQQDDSNPFNITPATANSLAFVQQPGTTVSGAAFNPVITVRINDAYGNLVTTANNQITLAVSAGATLGGTYTNVAASSGIATFSGVTVSGPPASTYTLTATAAGLSSANSNSFSITVTAPPQVTTPSPATGATGVSINPTLSWAQASNATSYGIYFGTSATPPFVVTNTDIANTTYTPSTLINNIQYYWQINSSNAGGTTTGVIWSFTTIVAAPAQVTTPSPSNGATGVSITTALSWASASGATSYDVYFGTSSPGTSQGNTTNLTYDPTPNPRANNTLYYWRIDSVNAGGTTTGVVWSFTTVSTVVPPTCTTNAATNVVSTSAIGNGNITDLGGAANATVRGFYYGLTQADTWSVSENGSYGTGAYSLSITGLSPSTPYYFRTFATNSAGTGYGSYLSFTTAAPPAVDDYCWVANYNSNNVTRITKSTSATTNIAVGTNPTGVAVDETYVWIANNGSNNVTRITKSTLATTTIPVGSYPYGVAVDATYVWVANYGSNNITRITKSTLTTTNIAAGSAPFGVAVDGTYVWVPNAGANNVTRITKSTLVTTTIAAGTTSYGVAVAVDQTYCWVSNYSSNYVTRIQKSNLSTTTVTVGSAPLGVAVDETYCWGTAAYIPDAIFAIGKSDSAVYGIPTGADTRGYGISVDGDYVWVGNQNSNTVTRITKATNATTNIAVGTGPFSLGDMTGYAYDNYANQ